MHSSKTPAEKIYETDQTPRGARGCLRLSAGFSAGRRKRLDQTTKVDSHGGLRPDKHSCVLPFVRYLLNLHQLSLL